MTICRHQAVFAKAVAERGGPALVIGSTGFSPNEERVVRAAAKRCAIVKSGNFSLGVNMLIGLVNQAARALPAADYDIEVFEAHHKRKLDGPSGTALMLGQAAGTAASLAIDAGVAVQDVSYSDLASRLQSDGQIVAPRQFFPPEAPVAVRTASR